jgi:hypothetical protein
MIGVGGILGMISGIGAWDCGGDQRCLQFEGKHDGLIEAD